MAGFKYTLGINELSSKKHKLTNALLAEFVGKWTKNATIASTRFVSLNFIIRLQMNWICLRSFSILISFSFSFSLSPHLLFSPLTKSRDIFIELFCVCRMHIRWSNNDVICIWSDRFCCRYGKCKLIFFMTNKMCFDCESHSQKGVRYFFFVISCRWTCMDIAFHFGLSIGYGFINRFDCVRIWWLIEFVSARLTSILS